MDETNSTNVEMNAAVNDKTNATIDETNSTNDETNAIIDENDETNATIDEKNPEERRLKRRRGMQKMVTVGSRVSAKCGKLSPNPRGSRFRRIRERIFGNVTRSVGDNRYAITFDDGTSKEIHSNSLRIEDQNSGIPLSESRTDTVEVDTNHQDEDETQEHMPSANENLTPAMSEQGNDQTLCDDTSDDVIEDDDGMNAEVAINIGDINLPADTPNTTVNENRNDIVDGTVPLSYHQKLEQKRNEIKNLAGNTVTKVQRNVTMTWTVVEESIPHRSEEVAELRDNLSSKLGLKNLMEFLIEYGYEDSESRNSCSASCTTSNIDRKTQNLQESTIFAELFLKLTYKDWDAKLSKMNRYIDEANISNPNRTIKPFEHWDFIIGHALLIGASCYCQSGSVLFSNIKDSQEDMWDTIIQNARFDRYMKLYRFKEFRLFLPKVFELPMEKDHDPWWAFSSAITDFNDIRNHNILSSWVKVLDETMSAWRPRTSKNGGLPNISYIIRKPEPLGTEFKTVCCPVTGVMTRMEIQRGNNVQNNQIVFTILLTFALF